MSKSCMLNDGNDRKHQPESRSERYGLQKPIMYEEFNKGVVYKCARKLRKSIFLKKQQHDKPGHPETG